MPLFVLPLQGSGLAVNVACAHRLCAVLRRKAPVLWRLAGVMRLVELMVALVLLGVACVAAPVDGARAEEAVRRWVELTPQPMGKLAGVPVGVETYADSAGLVRFHVVALSPSGFVVVAADDEVEPILAFSCEGRFVAEAGNPLYDLLLCDTGTRRQLAPVALAGTGRRGGVPSRENAKWRLLSAPSVWRASDAGVRLAPPTVLDDVRVAPLVQTKWGQQTIFAGGASRALYNYYTPPNEAGNPKNYPSGCGATARAQIMRFHQWPKTGVGTASFTIRVGTNATAESRSLRGGDGLGGPYDWESMVLDPDDTITEVQRKAIGALMHDVGVATNMDYSSSGSGSNLHVDVFRTVFGYPSSNDTSRCFEDIMPAVRTNLDAGLPVTLGIRPPGHYVVCDGYGYNLETLYHHINLGWDGTGDAWYQLPEIDAGGRAFRFVEECHFNMAPVSVAEIVSGRLTDSLGNPMPGVDVTISGPTVHHVTTNAQGMFVVTGLASNATWTVSHNGGAAVYGPASVQVTTGDSRSSAVGNRVVDDFQIYRKAHMLTQPDNACVGLDSVVRFTSAAAGIPMPSLQWQMSADGGTTWQDLSDTPPYSGVTTGTLIIGAARESMNGLQYRCLASNTLPSNATSRVAALTVVRAGSLVSTGNNDLFQLGDGTDALRYSPVRVLDSDVQSVAAGHYSSLAIKADGSLWAMGCNSMLNLPGFDANYKFMVPTCVVPAGVQSAAMGDFHFLIVKTDGSLCVHGNNAYGQVGTGRIWWSNSVMETIMTSGVRAVAAGRRHSVVLKTDGSLWAMGYNEFGQVGDGTTTNVFSPVCIFQSGVQSIAAGEDHTLVVKTDGSLWAMGDNEFGQLGDGTTTMRTSPVLVLAGGVQSVAAGNDHSLIVKTDGSLWVMGRNDEGQLGDGTTTMRTVPVQIVPGGVRSAVGGGYHSFFVKTDGSLWGMGSNWSGQLGDGARDFRATPVPIPVPASADLKIAAGRDHSLIVMGSDLTPKGLFIDEPPATTSVCAGVSTTFHISAMGPLPLSYRWQVSHDGGTTWTQVSDGTSHAGAETAALTVLHPTLAMHGDQYRCIVSDGVNAEIASAAALLNVGWSQFSALSARAPVGAGAKSLFMGFVYAGGGKPTIVRGVGPGLVSGDASLAGQALADPQLMVHEYQASGFVLVDRNNDWGGADTLRARMTSLGMSALAGDSKDAAMLLNPTQSIYTAQVSGVGDTTGLALAETYDADFADKTKRLTALSVRNHVGAGAAQLIVGFVIDGDAPRRVILRGVGPGLLADAPELAGAVLENPTLQLNRYTPSLASKWTVVGSNDDWGGATTLAETMHAVGMSALPAASKDAVLLVELQPGIYTAQITGVGDTTGIALVEIYEAP